MMHPRTAELIRYIDAQHARLRSIYELVAHERRMLRADPERWSPAEVVHHLVIVERLLVPKLTRLVEEARALPPETDTSPLFPMQSATRVEIRGRRIKTWDFAEPKDTDADSILDDYSAVRAAFKEVIAAGDGLALGAVFAPHPIFGPFSGYEWIAFAGAHSARHADQIREMTVSLA